MVVMLAHAGDVAEDHAALDQSIGRLITAVTIRCDAIARSAAD